MRKKLLWCGLLCVITLTITAYAQTAHSKPLLADSQSTATSAAQVTNQGVWHTATPKLKTRWFDAVSPTNALPEYPRPQMVRTDWLNLNGLWQFAPAKLVQDPPFGQQLAEQILVPFPVESPLSGLQRHEKSMWYRRLFDTPTAWSGKRILLHFDAIDWLSVVYINGKKVGIHYGGYDAFSYDVTPYLKAQGPQEVIVMVYDPTNGGQPHGKQSYFSSDIWYTSTSGIWQTVWLEPVTSVSIDHLDMTPNIDNSTLNLRAVLSGNTSGSDYMIEATAFDGGQPVARTIGQEGSVLKLSIPNEKLWSPDNPFLYDLQVTVWQGNTLVDHVSSYFGMRKISLGKLNGITRILLNNQFIFQIGPLDQGFWPDGIYTAPTDDALKYDLELEKQLGWNMVRKHIKIEPDRWYYWTDKLGLLVWQDMPSGDSNNVLPEPDGEFETELTAMIAQRHNHPSIVLWVLFNENWGQTQFGKDGTIRLSDLVKTLDPSRLVTDATGWTDYGVGDIVDSHNYVGPASPIPEANRAAVEGEFGGLGLEVAGHDWDGEPYAYEWETDSAALTRRYIGLIGQVKALMIDKGLSAAVYTELSDIEHEHNGFTTYDRQVTKVDVKAIQQVNADLIRGSTQIGSAP